MLRYHNKKSHNLMFNHCDQRRIQDFPDGGDDTNLLFGRMLAENCRIMKEIGQKGGRESVRPLGSANGDT